MPQLFTVRWPFFARVEAFLLFPVAVMLASELALFRSASSAWFTPALSLAGAQMGLREPVIVWASMTVAVLSPYFVTLMVIDRFLTVRKGFAILSLAAVSVWVIAAVKLSTDLAGFVPDYLPHVRHGLSFTAQCGLAAGGIAFILHLRPLWIGLRDEGDVAMRMLSIEHGNFNWKQERGQARRDADVYYQHAADLRHLRPPRQMHGLAGGPRENPAVVTLWAITWVGIATGVGLAYYKGIEAVAPQQLVIENSARPGLKNQPEPLPGTNGPGSSNVHTVEVGPLPVVQRPGPMPTVIQPSYNGTSPDEADAERGNDGSFVFDAMVNGTHVPMMFDTGASVVALRAEDAEHLGIALSRLRYSARVKTANGTAEVAPVIIDTITIGNITQRRVVGFVAKEGTLNSNLLGQSFLTRLAGFSVESNRLVLKGH
jgi:clan AA aspartic protease (TIGR02281 family)